MPLTRRPRKFPSGSTSKASNPRSNSTRKRRRSPFGAAKKANWTRVNDIFQTKCIKRGISLMSFDYKERDVAFGGSVRQTVLVQAGVSKEKGKEIIAALKDSKLKVQAQIQDEQVRVTGKNRDDLQSAISYLRPSRKS